MILIPALELAGGKVVRAGSDEVIADDPVPLVKKLGKQGAVYFHLQDRDGEGGPAMARLVEEIVPFQVGGPGCGPDAVQGLLEAGADRVVVPVDGLEAKARKALAKSFGVRVLGELGLSQDPARQLEGLSGAGLRQAVLRPEGGKLQDCDVLQAALAATDLDVFLWSAVEDQDDFAALRALAGAGLRGVILDQAMCGQLLELAQTA